MQFVRSNYPEQAQLDWHGLHGNQGMHGHWHGQLLLGGGVVTPWDVVGNSVTGCVTGGCVTDGCVTVGCVTGGCVTGGGVIVASEAQVGINWSIKSHRWFKKLKNWNGGHSRVKRTTPAPFPPHCQ